MNDLLGKRYQPEVEDCFQAARKYFANLGIEIRDYAFPQDFWEYEDNMYGRLFDKEGFYVVDTDRWKPRPHDVLLIPGSTRVSFPTHVGILTEEGKVFHHYTDRVSELSDFKGIWRTPTMVLRHPDVPVIDQEQVRKDVPITELLPEHVKRRLKIENLVHDTGS